MKLFPIADVPIPPVEILARTEDGQIAINPQIQGLNLFYLTFVDNNAGLPIIQVIGSGVANGQFVNDRSGYIEAVYLTYYATSDQFLIAFKDEGSGKYLQNRPIHIKTIGGTGQKPGILPVSLIFDPGRILTSELTDLSGVNNYIWVYLTGSKYYYEGALTSKKIKLLESNARKKLDLYFYTTSTDISMPSGDVTRTGRIVVSEEHCFVVDKINAKGYNGAGAEVDFLWKVREEATGRQWSSSWMLASATSGQGSDPFVLAQKIIIDRNKAISIDFRNYPNTEAKNIYFTLLGHIIDYPSAVEV